MAVVDVSDIGSSTSFAADLSTKFDARLQSTLGPIIHNVGSGAKSGYYGGDTRQDGTSDMTTKLDAVSSNAKAGDGGVAESSAHLTDAGIQKGVSALSTLGTLNPWLIGAGLLVAGGLGVALILTRRKK